MLEEANSKIIKEITELVNQTKINELNNRLEYRQEVLKCLSKELKKTLGSRFSVSNLRYMRRFYLEYPKQQTLSVKLIGNLENNVFASMYTYYIPNKEQLINEVERVLNEEVEYE